MDEKNQTFYKFYREHVLKKSWSFFFVLSELASIFLWWFIDKSATKIILVGILICVGIAFLLVSHFFALKSLFSKYKKENKSKGYNTGLPDSYQNILDEIASKMPNLLPEISEKFDNAYKQMGKNNIKSIIIKHYIAYKPIKSELDKLYEIASDKLIITPKNSMIRAELESDCFTLKKYHTQMHTDKNTPSFTEIKDLVSRINDNFYTLLMEIQP